MVGFDLRIDRSCWFALRRANYQDLNASKRSAVQTIVDRK